jgi:PAS domain S-box-containing protein/putative nucleotidyltransferase with HDIG domain
MSQLELRVHSLDLEIAYNTCFKQAPDAVFLLDLEGRHKKVNHRAAQMLGYTPDEVERLSAWEVSAESEQSALILQRLLNGEEIPTYERLFRKKNGDLLPVEINISLLHDSNGEPYLIQSMVRDISQRKHAENRINTQLQQLRALDRISVTINASLDLKVSLETILNEVLAQLNADAADVLFLDQSSYVLSYAHGKGFHTNEIKSTKIRYGEGVAGKALLQKKVLHLPNPGSSQEWLRANLLKSEQFVDYYAIPLTTGGKMVGILEIFHRSPIQLDEDGLWFLELIGEQVSIAISNSKLFTGLEQSNIKLIQAYDATIEGWSNALDLRDKETEGHTLRVTELTEQLIKAAGILNEDLVHIRRGALLHDIGKMGIPDAILLKPDKLTETEWKIMKQHPEFAYKLLSPIQYLQPALDIPYCHHEKWDGSGYPRGLKGEEIPFAARVFAVVDVWDALRSDRPYRKSWAPEKVLEHIQALSGTHFDPKVVNLFIRFIHENNYLTNAG